MTEWDRIRTISVGFEGPFTLEEQLVNQVYHGVAGGIINKLREFNKYEKIDLGNGIIRVTCRLSILVPYPSERSVRPGPVPEKRLEEPENND